MDFGKKLYRRSNKKNLTLTKIFMHDKIFGKEVVGVSDRWLWQGLLGYFMPRSKNYIQKPSYICSG